MVHMGQKKRKKLFERFAQSFYNCIEIKTSLRAKYDEHVVSDIPEQNIWALGDIIFLSL
jgi:hypothetical protein